MNLSEKHFRLQNISIILVFILSYTSVFAANFGNGSDGDAVIPSLQYPSYTTLESDMNFNNLTISAGATLDTAGFTVRVCGILINYGTITDSVSGGQGGMGGSGGQGGDPFGPGPEYPTQGQSGSSGEIGNLCLAGHGGSGGGGGGGGGGAWWKVLGSEADANGGDGGKGGNGGVGGGQVILYVKDLLNYGEINADGGDGASGNLGSPCEYYQFMYLLMHKDLAGGGGGGGGGGNGGEGGTVVIYYLSMDNQGTIQAQGGAGGSGGSGGQGHELDYGVLSGGHDNGASGATNGGDGGDGAHQAGDESDDGENGASGNPGDEGVVRLIKDCEADLDVNALHYELDIIIDPDDYTGRITGSNTMEVMSQKNDLDVFYFRLSEDFYINTVTVDSISSSWVRISEAIIKVILPYTMGNGDIFTVKVDYDGHPQCEDVGCLFTDHNGDDLVYTRSEPWSSYLWWPVKANNVGKEKADLIDKTTADLIFTVPDTMEVASNGLLQSTIQLPGNLKKFHWKTDYQTAPYLLCFAATNYVKHTDTYYFNGSPLNVEFYIYPEDETHLHEWTDKLEYMFNVFNDKFGMYPYMDEKYGIAQVESPGGIEHQTMTFQKGVWGNTWHGYDRSEMVTAHELSHQWWGDMVTCMTWNEIWLNEGFASYSEAIWIENADSYLPDPSYGEEAFHAYMQKVRFDPSFNPPGVFPTLPGETVIRNDISTHDKVFDFNMVYAKAAWILHMLRGLSTDEKFYCFLKHFRGRFEFSSSDTNDLMNTAQDVYRREGPDYLSDLSWFFDEWIYDQGAPLYNCWWYYKNFSTIVVKIAQRQRISGYPFDPVFIMPIEIVYVQGGVNTKTVLFDDPDDVICPVDTFEIHTGGIISKLLFDPDNKILKRLSLFPPGSSPGSNSTTGSGVVGTSSAEIMSDIITINPATTRQ